MRWLTPHALGVLNQRRSRVPRQVEPDARRAGQVHQRRSLDYAYTSLAIDLEERMASRLGVELRHPLRAPSIVRFAVATPERLRVRGLVTKFLHVEAMQGSLPGKVLRRRGKAEFSGVFRTQRERFGASPDRQFAERTGGWIVPEEFDRLLRDGRNQSTQIDRRTPVNSSYVLWNFLACELLIDRRSNLPQ
jgi:asparagine synthase (glutamine-hydrolysing)